MRIRIVINGREVENPLSRFLLGLFAVLILTLFGVVVVVFILPLVGVTLILSFSLVAYIILASLAFTLASLATRQHRSKKQRRLKSRP